MALQTSSVYDCFSSHKGGGYRERSRTNARKCRNEKTPRRWDKKEEDSSARAEFGGERESQSSLTDRRTWERGEYTGREEDPASKGRK